MEYPVRILNQDGLMRGSQDIAQEVEPQLFLNWINEPEYSSKANIDVSLDSDFNFDNKLELAKYLHSCLGDLSSEHRENPGLWTWICFLYLDKLVKRKNNGTPQYSASPNYILTHKGHSSSLSYRHRIYSWYGLYERYGEKSKFFLSTDEPFSQGAVIENIASRYWLTHQHFDLIYDLYFDENTNRVIVGFDNKEPKYGEKKVDGKYKGAGKMRRLTKVLSQLETVYILKKMDLKKRKDLLGDEFKNL